MIEIEKRRFFSLRDGDMVEKVTKAVSVCDECGKKDNDPIGAFLVRVSLKEGYRVIRGTACTYECALKLLDKFVKEAGGNIRDASIRYHVMGVYICDISDSEDDYTRSFVFEEDPKETLLAQMEYHAKRLRNTTQCYESVYGKDGE